MAQWPGWARSYVVQTDLLATLIFEEVPDENADFRIRHLEPRNQISGSVTFDSSELFSFKRPSLTEFRRQLDYVNTYSELRLDRSAEILSQTGYPEHFHGVILGLHPDRTRYTLELMAMAQLFATGVAQRVKHALACKRPDMFSSQIQPMIPMPGHGTLPSGHATEAFTVARVMSLLVDDRADTDVGNGVQDQLMHQAERIAINRTIAGVHFPADSIAGAMLGLGLGEYFVARANGLGVGASRGKNRNAGQAYTKTIRNRVKPARFDGTNISSLDFRMRDLFRSGERQSLDNESSVPVVELLEAVEVSERSMSRPLRWLWERAKEEWPARTASDMW
ncbi:phosphatase PAP2 family protein [Ruegeria hyattellae]|uniref:phosphatase PAP2 family protein n=1 Tax=Ruegeria hyattellae TaxID=3233337 RepID=UPI00355BD1BA